MTLSSSSFDIVAPMWTNTAASLNRAASGATSWLDIHSHFWRERLMISCSTAVFMRLSFAVDGEWWESCGLGLWIRAGLRNAICRPHSNAEEGTSSRRTRVLRIGMVGLVGSAGLGGRPQQNLVERHPSGAGDRERDDLGDVPGGDSQLGVELLGGLFGGG